MPRRLRRRRRRQLCREELAGQQHVVQLHDAVLDNRHFPRDALKLRVHLPLPLAQLPPKLRCVAAGGLLPCCAEVTAIPPSAQLVLRVASSADQCEQEYETNHKEWRSSDRESPVPYIHQLAEKGTLTRQDGAALIAGRHSLRCTVQVNAASGRGGPQETPVKHGGRRSAHLHKHGCTKKMQWRSAHVGCGVNQARPLDADIRRLGLTEGVHVFHSRHRQVARAAKEPLGRGALLGRTAPLKHASFALAFDALAACSDAAPTSQYSPHHCPLIMNQPLS